MTIGKVHTSIVVWFARHNAMSVVKFGMNSTSCFLEYIRHLQINQTLFRYYELQLFFGVANLESEYFTDYLTAESF